jgi:hypothetical protein
MRAEEFIRKAVSYDPATGELRYTSATPDMFPAGKKSAVHNCNVWNALNSGRVALASPHREGYHCGSVVGRKFLAHRVAWFKHYGAWPAGEIDHINHDRTDNRIQNLRVVSREQNSKNLSTQTRRKGEPVGVYWYAPTSRWVVKINHNRRALHVGYFTDKAAAIAARKAAEQRLGFHKNHGAF